ncbi:hypothetical protein B0H10DRAFT_2101947, partial [Mycena sp. CBHHK59/15]
MSYSFSFLLFSSFSQLPFGLSHRHSRGQLRSVHASLHLLANGGTLPWRGDRKLARVRRGTTSTPPRSDICVAGDADVAHWKYELRRAVVVGSGKKEWGGLNMPAVADARSRPPLPCTFPPLLAVHDRC